MTKPETTSRAGEAVPGASTPADEVKTALAGLAGDINERFEKQEERLNMLSAKSTLSPARRPALATAHEAEAPHQKAFAAYLRTGEDDAQGAECGEDEDARDDSLGHDVGLHFDTIV